MENETKGTKDVGDNDWNCRNCGYGNQYHRYGSRHNCNNSEYPAKS